MQCRASDRGTFFHWFVILRMAQRHFCLFTIALCGTFSQFSDITDSDKMKSALFLHRNCRNAIYPHSTIERTHVPDQLVAWTTEFIDYRPKQYESPTIEGKPWADPKQGID